MNSEHARFFYDELYASVDLQGPLGWFHRVTHKHLESAVGRLRQGTVLEVGVNRGEHLSFVKHEFDVYIATDLRITHLDLMDSASDVLQVACSVQTLPFGTNTFDRVVVTCVLHHLQNPLTALREIRRVTRPGGVISILLPCDPGVVYRTSWSLTSGRRLRKLGVASPHLHHALEHPGHFGALHTLVSDVFGDDTLSRRWWPWHLPSWNLNLFAILVVKVHKSIF